MRSSLTRRAFRSRRGFCRDSTARHLRICPRPITAACESVARFPFAPGLCALDFPSYNFVIHTSPIGEEINDHYHWHIEMMPKLTKVAGFEWGTGFYINPTPPEEAARFLREAKQQ